MPSPVAELLRDLASSLDALGIRWYVFGAQAAIVHGAARLTADVDVTVLLPTGLSARVRDRRVVARRLITTAERVPQTAPEKQRM